MRTVRFGWRPALVLLTLLLAFSAFAAAATLNVHFLDVDQGDAIAVETPEGVWALIDGGPREAGYEAVVPYLQDHGVRKLTLLVMTHPHADHIGGLAAVIEKFPVEKIIADGQVHTTRTYEDLLKLILDRQIPFVLARKGQVYNLGKEVRLAILSPPELIYDHLNDNSVVAILHYKETSFLFTGDIGTQVEADLVREGAIPADVLKVAHHGSRYSTGEDFLTAVSPFVAVISVGPDNRYGHPAREVVNRLQAHGVVVRRTDQDGTIVISTDGSSELILKSNRGVERIPLTGKPVRSEPEKELEPGLPAKSGKDKAGNRMNVNTASASQLETLPGIGPVLADRIIAYRQAHPFQNVDELLQVKGIGSKTLEKLRPLITVD